MKFRVILLILACLLLIFAVSCASAPAPEATKPTEGTTPPVVAPPPVATTPDQASLNALNAAAARAEAARKLVEELEGQSFFPEEWQSAESLYSQAERQRDASTIQSVRDSTARYNSAADAYEALAKKSVVSAYEYAEKELTAAREAAVAAGAETLIPDFLLDADNTVVKALEAYQANDYYAAKESALDAYNMYTALKSGLDAYKLREEIAARQFERYDPHNVSIADDALNAAANYYSAGDYEAALRKTEEAMLLYSGAMKTAWASYSGTIRAEAAAERQKALDAKANVAVKPEFDAAELVYSSANSAYNGQRYSEAALLYERCLPMFTHAAALANEKRLAAEAALRRADESVARSDEAARSVEILVEGGLE